MTTAHHEPGPLSRLFPVGNDLWVVAPIIIGLDGRFRGQTEAIERALESEAGCEQVTHLIAGVRGSMNGLMAELVEHHVRTFLVQPSAKPGNTDAAEQFIEVVHTYL